MRTRSRRIKMTVVLLLGGAFMLAGPGTGCMSFIADSALTTTDLCFIFDCQNGILGGTIDPCAGTTTGQMGVEQPLFTDCPNFTGP